MTSTLSERKQNLISLGYFLSDIDNQEIIDVCIKAELQNPWFTQNNILKSIDAIRVQFLSADALDRLIETYYLDDNIIKKTIGLIPAGNIPLVGFHDMLCCYLVGHDLQIKLSEKDDVLMRFVINIINAKHQHDPITIVDKLTQYDAVIATGSDNSARIFQHYFSHVPAIIRHNRTSVAIIKGDESFDDLMKLGDDIFSYFGLGCRNVGKIFIPDSYELAQLFEAFIPFQNVILHNKYKNNFDYNIALWLLGKEQFFHNDFIAFKITNELHARIASVNIEYYSDIRNVIDGIKPKSEKIQCVVSQTYIPSLNTIPFGIAQYPDLLDYPDQIDTIQFLLKLN